MSQLPIDFAGAFHFDKQNTAILLLIRAAGTTGISDLELHRATGIPRSSICARRGYDLRTLIEPTGRYQDEKTKRSYTRWKLKGATNVSD